MCVTNASTYVKYNYNYLPTYVFNRESRVQIVESRAVAFLDGLLAQARHHNMIDCFCTDVPWNCMLGGSGKNSTVLRDDDTITLDAVEKLCSRIKSLLSDTGESL